ncbi:hypothetical protein [Bartonella schoenbuchensis]|uniref:Phage protein n=2 Tax=Bartonella schoenbuchensis (strain DSM 13525 / NCTC 13165 / R1) TaxID=687861 RepID=E6Z0Y3_BARSR|nr:hypothetical protein [Bartonella schoenbuchensis]AQX30608.1 hypothetical protein BscR1v2_006680 [Bartonella schoenbuchensis R1]AQX31165.1 hypothetical protein BscR1v2_012510 [Bartonella schoenbuchensis R1]CBI82771.1 phage protein [Bartonella schoenbuchensis R1]
MNKKNRQGLSIRAFAKKMGVYPNAVVARFKTGKFDEAIYDDGSINEELATVLWNENPTKQAYIVGDDGKPRTKTKQDSIEGANEYEIKLKRMQVALEREKIALEQLRETTVDREEMKKAVSCFARTHRDAMLHFPHRYGARIAAQVDCDTASLIGTIDYYIREALQEAVDIPLPFHDQNHPDHKEEKSD